MKFLFLIIALPFFLNCCTKMEFDELPLNVYDNSTNVENAVTINAFRIVNFNVVNGDTSSVNLEIDVSYSTQFYNNNNVLAPKMRFATLLYLNDVNIPRKQIQNTNTIVIEQPYSLLKNRSNYLQFKLNLVNDKQRIRVASKTYSFNLY